MNLTPNIGHNTKGIASITNDGSRPVVVEYVDNAVGFLHVRDLETNKPYTIFRTSFMPSNTIPAKYRKAAFDRVANHWANALINHPLPVVLDPTPLASISFVRLLRDGREAKNTYGWLHKNIIESLWTQFANDLSVTEMPNGMVSIGLQSAKFPADGLPVGKVISTELVTQVEWTDPAQLDALCFVLERKLLHPRPNLVVSNLNESLILSLESRYEVGFVQHETDKNKWSIV